jgi:hypothetical protein
VQSEPFTVTGSTLSAKAGLAPVTVNMAEPGAFPDSALIIVVPAAADVANPLDPVVLLMVATSGADETQVIDFVRFCVKLFE